MNFEISKTLAADNPGLEKAIKYVDQLMANTQSSGMFLSKAISKVSGLDRNQIDSVLELYEEEKVMDRLHGIECSNCGNLNAFESEKTQTCSQCELDLDGEEVVSFKFVASKTEATPEETHEPEGVSESTVPLSTEEKNLAFNLLKSRVQNNKDRLKFILELNTSASFLGSINWDKPIDNLLIDVVNLAHGDKILGELFKSLAGDEEDDQRKANFLKAASAFEKRYREIDEAFAKDIENLSKGGKRLQADSPEVLIDGLEKVTGSAVPFGDVEVLVDTLSNAKSAVCQIKSEGKERGTGFLISDQHVLTCYHNILDDNKHISSSIKVRFDFYKTTEAKLKPTEWFSIDPKWPIPHTPYSKADLKANPGEPRKNELDYAILKLSSPLERPCFELDSAVDAKAVQKDSRIFIVGHPGTPIGNDVTTPLQALKYSV